MTRPLLRRLGLAELQALYTRDLRIQFPEDEVRPWANLRRLWGEGRYAGWALRRGEDTLCYAFLATAGKNVLVDYLATIEPWKNRGYGSLLLSELRGVLPGAERILIESEDPDALAGGEAAMARRRLGFYARNGFAQTDVRVRLFGVAFRILSSESGPGRDARARAGMEDIYREIVPAPLRGRAVCFEE